MKTGSVVLLAVAGLALYSFAQLGTASNTAQLIFSGVTVNSPTSFTLHFVVQNISNATVKFNGLTGTVSVNGTVVGNLSTFSAVTIQPVSQQNLNVSFQPSLLGVASQVADMIRTGNQTLDFSIEGNYNIDSFVLPFSVQNSVTV